MAPPPTSCPSIGAPARRFAARRAGGRVGVVASTAALALATSIVLGGCGQFGPLRFPEESTAQARSRADARRLPETRRDAPIPTTDPVGNPSPR